MDELRDGPEWGYCQEPGCHELAIPCWMPDSDYGVDEPDDLLCADHCKEAGYCWGCGHFCAGIESFDFNKAGLCSNCKDVYTEDDYDDIDYDYMWDLP